MGMCCSGEQPCPLRKATSFPLRKALSSEKSHVLCEKGVPENPQITAWVSEEEKETGCLFFSRLNSCSAAPASSGAALKASPLVVGVSPLAEGVDTPGIPSRTVLCQLCRSVLLPGVPEQGHCPWGRHQRVCARVLCQNTACSHFQITQAPIWDPSPCFPGCDCQPSVLPPRCPQKFGVSTNTHLSFCSSCRA